ncbi:MAG TPA: FAD-dependent oxidoreductase [Candidatus Acidoferrales bacterium]|nr:FAD-dependent oxidoreductase [Candidatus Acidoferrales bacterium]
MPVTYEATIERIAEIAPQTRSFFLRLPSRSQFHFKAGQFLSFSLPVGGATLTRPYTVASGPEDELLEICLNLVPNGPGSNYLFGLQAGDVLRFTGPWGTFTFEHPPDAECVFISEGTGIAAIRPMLRRALTAHGSQGLHLHQAAPDRDHLLYSVELEAAAASHPRFNYEPLVARSLQTPIVERYIDGDSNRSRHFFICGVGDIVPQLRDRLRHAGYERRAVQYEKW